jgi:hypothetical protein
MKAGEAVATSKTATNTASSILFNSSPSLYRYVSPTTLNEAANYVTRDCWHCDGYSLIVGEYSLMQFTTNLSSVSWRQALKKSACMLEASPEESVTVPAVVGMGNLMLSISIGTGVGWVSGHWFGPPSLGRTL